MNIYSFTGNLSQDPDLRFTEKGTAIMGFNVAINDWRDKENTLFIKCTMFGKGAEIWGERLKKGDKIAGSGRLQKNSWEKDGVKHSTIQLIVDDIVPMSAKPSSDEGGNEGGDEGSPF